MELKKPEAFIVNAIDLKTSSYIHALSDESVSHALEDCLTDWCIETERLLNQSAKGKDGEELGPDTELEYWRSRMANLNSITEQLKLKECKVVLGVCGHAKSSAYIRWKALDVRVTDAANEAKDNVKYLATLEKSLEPMFGGRVEDITESLPSLVTNIKMMYSIARCDSGLHPALVLPLLLLSL